MTRPLHELLRKIEEAFSTPQEVEEDTPKHQYWSPATEHEVVVSKRWLMYNGVTEMAVHRAFSEADKEGYLNDMAWMDALHRVANRSVRKFQPGWEKFAGDWLDLSKAIAKGRKP